ncbi:MAG: hypothetical protein EBV58_08350, partial [Actinobacteria bacterium]|nr:hypothetical protein [Actinomycetota bacterium]
MIDPDPQSFIPGSQIKLGPKYKYVDDFKKSEPGKKTSILFLIMLANSNIKSVDQVSIISAF